MGSFLRLESDNEGKENCFVDMRKEININLINSINKYYCDKIIPGDKPRMLRMFVSLALASRE